MELNIDHCKDTVKKIVDDNCKVAIVGEIPVKCNTVSCNICKFTGEKDCQKEMLKWLMKEIKPEILDQKEHDYLEGVIRPFKQGVAYIKKHEDSLKEDEYIYITMKAAGGFCLPYFTKNSMYKGMELNKAYSPKELGL